MKRLNEKEIRKLELFCIVTALAADFLCVLFLLDVLQNQWFLNSILGLGILLHISLALSSFLRHRIVASAGAVLMSVAYGVSLYCYNFMSLTQL